MKKVNERKRKNFPAAFLCVCMALLLGGCGAYGSKLSYEYEISNDSTETQANGYAAGAGVNYVTEETAFSEASVAEAPDVADTGRKLIKNVDLSLETKEFDTMMSSVEFQVGAVGGYIERMNVYNGSSYSSYRGTRNASMTVRIPKDSLDGFLDAVSGIGNVISRSDSVDDVTLAYVDIESHRDALRVEQDRLLELLKQAESIEDIIYIEERLSNVRYQLESMESQLRTYDNKVDYSTVYLDITEVKELTPVAEKNAWERMADGFMDSLKDIAYGIRETGIWLVANIPYIVLWIVVIAAIILVVKVLMKRPGKKRDAEKEEK